MNLTALKYNFENIGVLEGGANKKKIAINNFNWLLFWIFVASILWSLILYFIGQPIAALFPIISTVVIPIILLRLNKTKKLSAPFNAFLIMMLILPALAQLFSGGFINSGAIIIWSTIAPIMAMAFKPTSDALRCFGFFILVIVFEMTIELLAIPSYIALSEEVIKFQFLINLMGVATISFFPLLGFTKKLSSTRQAVSRRNRTIGEGLKYAKSIQANILPSEEELSSILKLKTFLIFKPKAIVSGDFYWAFSDNFHSIIVCADCTGQGVPATFIALTATIHLNSIVKENNEKDPSTILTLLHSKLIASFNKSKDVFRDTIKLSICVINQDEKIINYASARSKVYFFNGISITKYRSDPFTVGVQDRKVKFTNRSIKFNHGDVLYLSTKGFINQFGEKDNAKLKSTNFMNSMNKYGPFPIENQKSLYLKNLSQWQGNREQTEDITFLGIEL